jgi:hypothetical protein
MSPGLLPAPCLAAGCVGGPSRDGKREPKGDRKRKCPHMTANIQTIRLPLPGSGNSGQPHNVIPPLLHAVLNIHKSVDQINSLLTVVTKSCSTPLILPLHPSYSEFFSQRPNFEPKQQKNHGNGCKNSLQFFSSFLTTIHLKQS